MYLQGREAEGEIKGDIKVLKKIEKLFECGRALDCKKEPFSSRDLCMYGLCMCKYRFRSDLSSQGSSHVLMSPGQKVGITMELEATVKVGVGAIPRAS